MRVGRKWSGKRGMREWGEIVGRRDRKWEKRLNVGRERVRINRGNEKRYKVGREKSHVHKWLSRNFSRLEIWHQ